MWSVNRKHIYQFPYGVSFNGFHLRVSDYRVVHSPPGWCFSLSPIKPKRKFVVSIRSIRRQYAIERDA